MNDSLPTDLIVAATIRRAAQDGVAIYVRQRGDSASGVVILKINLLNGSARVLSQVRYDEELVWSPVSRADPMTDEEAERYLETQTRIDPDCWILEIEDRLGRVWFEGRVV